ncbi:hypothetical protein [Mycoplasma sp. HS2188]|uniref:hypothetical protein n=1 Tax=Mycoplasma sp. HS2188 TaxID=2976765 RepID=UPI0021A9B216|nr:hypothetical protein [Mycoplasma sp. HS2188]MCT4469699.1 hypothetical protein [Mycoplasma sp. HS2188]
MKKKNLLSITALSPLPLVALAAACTNDGQKSNNNEDERKIASLTNTLKKAREDIEKSKKLIEKLTAQLEAQQNPNSNDQDRIADLEAQIELLNREIEKVRGKKIERSNVSAKKLLNTLSKFLTDQFPNELQRQFPERYESEKNVLNQIRTSVLATLNEYNNTPEDLSNFISWQQAIINVLGRASVVANYVNSGSSVVLLPVKADEQLAMLFQWRIDDIDRLIEAVKANQDSVYNTEGSNDDGASEKQKLIAELESYKEEYLNAKNEKLLMAQIASWYRLEDNTATAVAGKFINVGSVTDSIANRRFLAKYKVDPSMTISPFPVYQSIIDQEFIQSAKEKLTAMKNQVVEWLKVEKQKPFVRSLRYTKLYTKLISTLSSLISSTTGDSVKYSSFEYEKDVELFIAEAKELLSQLKAVDFEAEKAKLDKLVDDAVGADGTLWTSFASRNTKEFRENEDNYEKMYKDFNDYYRPKIVELRNKAHSNFQESFVRYTQFLTLEAEINHAYKLIDLHKLLGDNINDDNFKALTKYDSTEEIDSKIKEQEAKIASYKDALKQKWDLIQALLQEYTGSTKEEALAYIQNIYTKANEDKTLLTTNFAEGGKWNSFYSAEDTRKMIEEFSNYLEFVEGINSSAQSKDYESLISDIQKIKEKTNKLKTDFFGSKTSLENQDEANDDQSDSDSYFVQFFNNLQEQGYETSGEEYSKQIQLFTDVLDLYNKSKDLNYDDSNLVTNINNIKTQLATVKQNVENAKDYNSHYDWNVEGEIVNQIRDDIAVDLLWLDRKLQKVLSEKESGNVDGDGGAKAQLASIKNRLATLIPGLGNPATDTPTNELTSSIKISIDTANEAIQNLNRRKRRIQNLAKLLPIQELLVLIRYYENNQKSKLLEILPKKSNDQNGNNATEANGGQDKEIADFFDESLKITSQPSSAKQITSVEVENFSHENPAEQNKIFQEFRTLEEQYANALIEFIENNEDSKENELKASVNTARNNYYEFLNSLKEKGVILDNKFIRMSADRYVTDEDAEDKLTPFDLLKKYVSSTGVNKVATNLYNEYVK